MNITKQTVRLVNSYKARTGMCPPSVPNQKIIDRVSKRTNEHLFKRPQIQEHLRVKEFKLIIIPYSSG